MSYARDYHMKGEPYHFNNHYPITQNSMNNHYRNRTGAFSREHDVLYMFPGEASGIVDRSYFEHTRTDSVPTMKRRKHSSSSWESYCSVPANRDAFPARVNASASTSASYKRDRSQREDDDLGFMSREEIERLSPSRRDGIDTLRETHLRYSYCAFLQDLGQQLELPQTTIGTAMVLCHRFFVRRSHAFHDRFLIATAALFLAAKSEETARPLNTVLRLSCEIYHKQDISFLSYLLPVDWFEQYRERVIEAEQLVLSTLNFELNVQHPFAPLMSIFNKLGLSQSMLMNVALNLISEGTFARLALIYVIFLAAGLMCCRGKFCFSTGVNPVVIDPNWKPNFLTRDPAAPEEVNQKPRLASYFKHLPRLFFEVKRLRSSLWLQFKPHQIAAGAAYLAAKFLNMDLASHHNLLQDFQATSSVLQDVAHQLLEVL